MKKIVLITFVTLFAAGLTYLLLPPQIPLSPLGQPSSPNNGNQITSPKYVILGFAPYWNQKKITPESLSTITHYAYFALHLDGHGGLYQKVNVREEDPGFTNYKRLLAAPPPRNLVLTFMQVDEDSLLSLLNSAAARQRAIDNILLTVSDSRAIGVNIDLEPVGNISPALRDNFTLFIQELHTRLKNSSPHPLLLTISIYPSAAVRPRLWDLPALAPLTDYFVVMTYDYTMPKSDRSGPNSPLRDFSGEFEHSIIKNLGELTKVVPPAKLLLGIALYGYQWDTVDTSKYAPTLGRGVTASLERIESMLQAQTLELLWDRNSLTPYGISTESGKPSQIYFENEASLRLKLDLVRASGLGGVALWALGYDNNVSWLWPTLSKLR